MKQAVQGFQLAAGRDGHAGGAACTKAYRGAFNGTLVAKLVNSGSLTKRSSVR
jgi:hypothetical protein